MITSDQFCSNGNDRIVHLYSEMLLWRTVVTAVEMLEKRETEKLHVISIDPSKLNNSLSTH